MPSDFPESIDHFPRRSNGIRYGVFLVSAITEAVENPTLHPNSAETRLVNLWRDISRGKKGESGGDGFKDWTGDRNGFRVSPGSILDSGVDPNLPVLSRELR